VHGDDAPGYRNVADSSGSSRYVLFLMVRGDGRRDHDKREESYIVKKYLRNGRARPKVLVFMNELQAPHLHLHHHRQHFTPSRLILEHLRALVHLLARLLVESIHELPPNDVLEFGENIRKEKRYANGIFDGRVSNVQGGDVAIGDAPPWAREIYTIESDIESKSQFSQLRTVFQHWAGVILLAAMP
jgi:hypothetical protein